MYETRTLDLFMFKTSKTYHCVHAAVNYIQGQLSGSGQLHGYRMINVVTLLGISNQNERC